MTFARWGIVPLLVNLVLVAWAVWIIPAPWHWAAVTVGGAWLLFVINFFRNPARTPEGDASCLISAADGVIADIEEVEEADFIGGRAIRIGVFMNVFDVHVNRGCIDGVVALARYRPGRYLDVRHPDASHENESHTLGIEIGQAGGPRILLRQLSGLIARRIVCTIGPGDAMQRGKVFGMIKFGSRVETWIPIGAGELVVSVGQRVRAGETILVKLGETVS